MELFTLTMCCKIFKIILDMTRKGCTAEAKKNQKNVKDKIDDQNFYPLNFIFRAKFLFWKNFEI